VWLNATGGVFGSGAAVTNANLIGGTQAIRLLAYDNRAAYGETNVAITVWPDADTNGLPDAWQAAFWPGGGSGGGTNDSDGDGFGNFEEWLAGTDPTNAASQFRILSLAPAAGGENMVIAWVCASNRHYTLNSATNPGSAFTTVTNRLWSTVSGTMSVTSAVPESESLLRNFYRVDLDR
jgi:hypothetical protein